MFVGVIQAALCNRLGASAMVANAPAAAYMLAFFAPLIMAPLIPYGVIANKFGYPASFGLGLGTGLVALWLIAKLPTEEARKLDLVSVKKVVRRGFID